MGKSSWFYVLISLNEYLAKLYVVANNSKCLQLKNNNEKVSFCSLLITEVALEGLKCTGHMAHLTTPDGAAGSGSPRSILAACSPCLGPHPFSAFQMHCCFMLVFLDSFLLFSVICQCFLFSGFFQISPSLRSQICPWSDFWNGSVFIGTGIWVFAKGY